MLFISWGRPKPKKPKWNIRPFIKSKKRGNRRRFYSRIGIIETNKPVKEFGPREKKQLEEVKGFINELAERLERIRGAQGCRLLEEFNRDPENNRLYQQQRLAEQTIEQLPAAGPNGFSFEDYKRFVREPAITAYRAEIAFLERYAEFLKQKKAFPGLIKQMLGLKKGFEGFIKRF